MVLRRRRTTHLLWCCFVVAAAALGDDHYATLKVKRTAKAKEIRAQYRKLAKKYHPDKNPRSDSSEKFQKIAAAYEVLGDEEKRAQYDEERRRPSRGSRPRQQDFGGGGGGRQFVRFYQNGRMYQVPLDSFGDFEDAFRGFDDGFRRGFDQRRRHSYSFDFSMLAQALVFGLLAMILFFASIGGDDDDDYLPPRPRRRPSPRPVAVSANSSVKELKEEAARRGLDTTGCAEKRDLVSLLGIS